MEQNDSNRRMEFRLFTYIFLLIFCFHGSKLVAQDCTPPGATITAPEILSCAKRTITLHGQSPTIGASFVWSGPNGFTSFSQDPVISFPGNYSLTITSPTGGCTSLASVVVQQDTAQPDARTSVSGIMTCANPTIIVSGLSSTQGSTFRWIGPGSFTSALQNLSVTAAGGYTLMVTNPANGCISTATAYVDKDVQLPTVSGYVSANLTCVVNTVQLTSSSATAGATFSWTGPGFASPVALQNTSTTVGGSYTITATNPANGCQSAASVNVIQDIAKPGATITASTNTITCAVISASLLGSSSTIGVNYSWTGPGLSRATQNVTVAKAGNYILTVKSSQNGCTSTASQAIIVNKTYPDATASVSSPITCSTSVVNLIGSSNTPGVNYIWYGPTEFGTLSGQTQTTAYPGGYVLGVSNQSNGCITTTAVDVLQDVTLPASVTATTNGTLTCTNNNVTLNAYSSTPGVNFTWSGPNGTSYSGTSPVVSLAGTYTLTVTNPVNGCLASTTTLVVQSKTKPSASAVNSGTITCLANSATLLGSSSTSGVTFQWKDQNNTVIASTQNTVIHASGIYTLVVTNPTNGCYANAVTYVDANLTKPELVMAGNDGPLTCSLLSTKVNASSSTSGVTYSWSGPSSFSSTAKNPTVNTPGTYHVTITNAQNGCTDTTSTYLAKNVDLPGASIATVPAITCTKTSVTIVASSLTSGVTYNWSGPNAFASTEQNPETNKMGDYTVTVTNPVNHCTSTASVTVSKDTIVPAGVTASAPDALTCTRLNVSLAATSADAATFSWTGPANFTSASQNPSVTLKGNYIVTVTKTSNGCKSFATATVVTDSIQPLDVNAVPSGILNCVNNLVTLTGSSSTPGVTYLWSGAGITSSTNTQSVTTGSTGMYNVIITNPNNGCYATASVTVEQDHTSPASVLVSSLGTLTCGALHVNVTASSSTNGVEYKWAGPGSFVSNEQTPSVSLPGTYSVTVTEPNSKCSVTASASVSQDTISPANVDASYTDIISCYTPSVALSGYSSTNGMTYAWNGPDNYNVSNTQSPIVSVPGLYTLTVTNPSNGCFKVRTLTLPADTANPADVIASVSGKLTCTITSVLLTGSTSTANVDYEWDGPSGNYLTSNPTVPAVIAGNYTLIVTNSDNGCSVARTVPVLSDKVIPTCSINVPNNSTVVQQTTNTISSAYSPSYAYNWTLTNWSPISGQTTSTMTYLSGNTGSTSKITLGLKDNNNGCTNTCSVNLSAVTTKSAIAELGGSAQAVEDLTLTTYPVPSAGEVFVDFASPEQTDVTVTVYNTSGSVVATLFNTTAAASQLYKLVFNETGTLPAGVYICVLKTKTKTITNKIMIK